MTGEQRPRIGQWIFRMPQCPKHAKAAIINHDGELVWIVSDTWSRLKPTPNGYWSGCYWAFNNGDNRIYCDNTDWKHSLVVRSESRNITAGGIKYMEA